MSCFNCAEIERTDAGENPWAVARLATGSVWLNPVQHFEGATFFVSRWCAAELHELRPDDRGAHLLEMAEVAAAVQNAFDAPKMNYEALGNSVPHLHWWLTPRRPTDARPRAPIWEDLDFLRASWTKQPTVPDERRQELRVALLDVLQRRELAVEPLVLRP